MNNLEEMEQPYYSELKDVKIEKRADGFLYTTITFIAEMEGDCFQFEQELWLDFEPTKESVKKYFNAELLDTDIDFSDLKCYDEYDDDTVRYQLGDAYISPEC